MSNIFGAIGALDFNNNREELCQLKPMEFNGKTVLLNSKNCVETKVYKKMSTKRDLDKKISSLKAHYLPYLKSYAPNITSKRVTIPLTKFKKYTLNDLSQIDVKSLLENESIIWEDINIPEYGGPVGYSISIYKTELSFKKNNNKAYFINFQCADYITEVFINGNYVGSHEGFFSNFEFDISSYIKDGNNSVCILLKNDYKFDGEGSQENEKVQIQGDKMYAATGIGYDDPIRGWHHCPAGTGLFGKISIEERNKTFLSNIFVNPNIDENSIIVETNIFRTEYEPTTDIELKYYIYKDNFDDGILVKQFSYSPFTLNHVDGSEIIYEKDIPNLLETAEIIHYKYFKGLNSIKIKLDFENFELWTQANPNLYRIVVELLFNGEKVDTLDTTFGMRKFEIDTNSTVKGSLLLNNIPIRLRGANTMGFEQNDVLNGNFEQLLYDLLMAKACNMNFLRLTQRPVQSEIYDMCDRIGLLIQSDLPLFTSIRRTKFTEALRQCEELCLLIRNHPSCVIMSYINEPMLNANNNPHRHLTRKEMADFFNCCDTIVSNNNPNVAIKHIDGDYNPPDNTLPDNHVYCFWYNGHGIDAGKLIRGYWVEVKKNWYCCCGEYGSEGLDPYPLMKKYYPTSWLPKNEKDSSWNPSMIKDSQSYFMHFFFYPSQTNVLNWIKASHKWQSMATRLQTEALRRNPMIVSSAIHLFIDAWPSGWMKTLVDCERNPKPALFEYADAISPIICSIRPDRTSYFSGEKATFQTFICNDTYNDLHNYKIKYELFDNNNNIVKSSQSNVKVPKNNVYMHGNVTFTLPKVNSRIRMKLRMILLNAKGKVIHYNDMYINIFKKETFVDNSDVLSIDGTEEFLKINNWDGLTHKYKKVIINDLDEGEYSLGKFTFKVKKAGMRPLHFVSCKTKHPYVKDFNENDFRFWFNKKEDMITPILYKTFIGDNIKPILLSGNTLVGSAWVNPVCPAMALGEFNYKGTNFIINEVDFKSHLIEPASIILLNRLYNN